MCSPTLRSQVGEGILGARRDHDSPARSSPSRRPPPHGAPPMSHRTPAAPLLTWSRDFPATPDQASGARQFLSVILAGHPAAEDASLCLSELVTNAMLHSCSQEPGGIFTVRALLHGSRMRVEVHDQGGPWLQPEVAGTERQNGRGLLIVDQLTAAWGRTGNHQTGWTVWFEI